jgi:hypothetical protein
MDPLQAQFEQSIGDQFASWLTDAYRSPCLFVRRGDPAPDLVYSFRAIELLVEITAAYYDERSHAKFLWKAACEEEDAPEHWDGINPDKTLTEKVVNRIRKKSKKLYPANTVLLIDVPPGVTEAEELTELLARQTIPDTSFSGIYVVGTFPMTSQSTGGYRVIPLKSITN